MDSPQKRWAKKHPEYYREAQRRWRAKNPEWARQKAREWYARNKKSQRVRCRAYYRANKPRLNKLRIAANRKKRYGIEPEEFLALFEAQRGLCAICAKPERSKGKSLSVDHNHKTGRRRRLLCGNCNRGLGCFFESVELMRKAIAYLEEHAA